MAQSFTLRTRRSRFRSLCLVTLFLSIWTSLTAAACYSRNGTLITSKAYQPCSKDTTRDSVCCGINHSGAGDTGVANDICETNGLCQNWEGKVGNEQPDKIWWRQGCTDPTWESPYCLKDVCNFDLVSPSYNTVKIQCTDLPGSGKMIMLQLEAVRTASGAVVRRIAATSHQAYSHSLPLLGQPPLPFPPPLYPLPQLLHQMHNHRQNLAIRSSPIMFHRPPT